MPASEIADILHKLSPDTAKEIFSHIGKDKAQKVKRLSRFADNVAGGLMTVSFHQETADTTISQLLKNLVALHRTPEAIIVASNTGQLEGLVPIKNIVGLDSSLPLNEVMKEPQFVFENANFEEIFRRFTEYNLRILPVVGENMIMRGIIYIDDVLAQIQEEEEKEDAV